MVTNITLIHCLLLNVYVNYYNPLPISPPVNVSASSLEQIFANSIQFLWWWQRIKCELFHVIFNQSILQKPTKQRHEQITVISRIRKLIVPKQISYLPKYNTTLRNHQFSGTYLDRTSLNFWVIIRQPLISHIKN